MSVGREQLAEAAHRVSIRATRHEAKDLVDQALALMTDALVAGERVVISGFAGFHPVVSKDRLVRVSGPGGARFGEAKMLVGHRKIQFRAAPELKRAVQSAHSRP